MIRRKRTIRSMVLGLTACIAMGQFHPINVLAEESIAPSDIEYLQEEPEFIEPENESPQGYEINKEIYNDDEISSIISNDNGEGILNDNADMVDSSGNCTDTINWTFENGVLTLTGKGEMPDYYKITVHNMNTGEVSVVEVRPDWYSFKDEITKVVVNDGITNISEQAFVQSTNLTEVILPDSVITIGDGAFAYCNNLVSFKGDGIESIGEYAFQGAKFETFTFSDKFHTLDDTVFFDTEIKNFEVHKNNPNFCSVDGVMFSKDMSSLKLYPTMNDRTHYVVPNTVKLIDFSAFVTCKNLRTIDLPDSLIEIRNSAFCRSSITSIEIPDSVTTVGFWVFDNCRSLKSVKFGKGLTSTSLGMFQNCNTLTDIYWGDGLQELGNSTFANCLSLTEVELPSTITHIGASVFAGCQYMTKFTCHNLDMLSFQTFALCYRLKEINLNEGMHTVERSAAMGCWQLEEVTIPESVTLVHSLAFDDNVNVKCKNPKMSPYGKHGYRILENVSINVDRNYDYAFEVLKLVNNERVNNGLSPLVMNESLLESGMVRAADISILYSHTRPNGELTFYVNDLIVAENIAYGNDSPESVVHAWMNSSGHKKNILNSEHTTIGIGCIEIDGYYCWVQVFGDGDDTTNCNKPANKAVTENIEIAVGEIEEDSMSNRVIFGDTGGPYTLEMILTNVDTQISKGKSANAVAKIKNPGSGCYVTINSDSVLWKSSNTSVANVTNGNINVVGDGYSEITCYTKDGGYKASKTIFTALPVLKYRTHVQTYGWQDYVSNGKMSGTSGEAKRLEGIEIKFDNQPNLGIRYKTHVQTYGWQDWKADGAMSGTEGERKRLEAICIELTGKDKDMFDVYYRVHAQSYGWMGWAKNGEQAGTAGLAKRLEGIEIVILPKGELPDTGYIGCAFMENAKVANNKDNTGLVNYMVHVQSYGDQSYVYDGSISGTSGESKRLEGIKINLDKDKLGASGKVRYRTHVQSYGWLDYVYDGEFSGTQGEGKRLEAIEIALTGDLAKKYDVYYRVHAQSYGWLGWAKNGRVAGTYGLGKRLEAIQIVIVPKGSPAPQILPNTVNDISYIN